jgi:hypothetical protein
VRDEAVRQVREMADAIAAPTPDLGRFERVRDWFVRHAPSVAGGVVSLVVHPLVGKLVEAAGDAAASQFRERFGAQGGG